MSSKETRFLPIKANDDDSMGAFLYRQQMGFLRKLADMLAKFSTLFRARRATMSNPHWWAESRSSPIVTNQVHFRFSGAKAWSCNHPTTQSDFSRSVFPVYCLDSRTCDIWTTVCNLYLAFTRIFPWTLRLHELVLWIVSEWILIQSYGERD